MPRRLDLEWSPRPTHMLIVEAPIFSPNSWTVEPYNLPEADGTNQAKVIGTNTSPGYGGRVTARRVGTAQEAMPIPLP